MHFAQFELSTLMGGLMLDEQHLVTDVILNWQAVGCQCERAGNPNTRPRHRKRDRVYAEGETGVC